MRCFNDTRSANQVVHGLSLAGVRRHPVALSLPDAKFCKVYNHEHSIDAVFLHLKGCSVAAELHLAFASARLALAVTTSSLQRSLAARTSNSPSGRCIKIARSFPYAGFLNAASCLVSCPSYLLHLHHIAALSEGHHMRASFISSSHHLSTASALIYWIRVLQKVTSSSRPAW